jgi:poly-gamma-glutamate synthesis protein (capsule biosynthesis protein)
MNSWQNINTVTWFTGLVTFAVFFQLSVTPKHVTKEPVLGSNVFIEITDESKQSSSSTTLITLIATGDIIPARSVNGQAVSRNDFTWAFKNIAPILNKADIALINLEAPLIKNCPTTTEGFVFCGRSEHIQGIEKSGVDVVNVANNHFTNYGQEGIDETVQSLALENIIVSGLPEQPVYKVVKGIKFAFLGYNDIARYDGISAADKELMKTQIQTAKKYSDVVVVSMHWGIEYVSDPDSRQKDLAHHAVDSGADLIIGNHPHWIQSEEYYKGKYIKYAHGNTIFDQMWSEETKKGVIGKYTFDRNNLINVEFIPTYIIDYGQATIINANKQ